MSDNPNEQYDSEKAANVIRQKLEYLYKDEPDADEEMREVVSTPHRSKHQQFMYKLTTSGKNLAEIQTEWHDYYSKLGDEEKREVWNEFYKEHSKTHHKPTQEEKEKFESLPDIDKEESGKQKSHSKHTRKKTVADIKRNIARKSHNSRKPTRSQHLKSIVFGLSMGSLVILITLFGFFNERFVAPFITPSREVSNTPIIIDPGTTAVSGDPEIIIPKINVEIPVVYNAKSTAEPEIQEALEGGVVHYPTSPKPGENGNAVVVGHSSNNIFNSGKYKFAFVLLKELENGDTFYLNYKGVRYAYKVYEKKIVSPNDVSVLGKQSKKATVTLITCDPPGTSRNRLIIVAEQISPDINKNSVSTASAEPTQTEVVPGNAPSLWSRITDWF